MSCIATYYDIADHTDIVHCSNLHDVIIHDEIVVVNCTDCLPIDTHSMQLWHDGISCLFAYTHRHHHRTSSNTNVIYRDISDDWDARVVDQVAIYHRLLISLTSSDHGKSRINLTSFKIIITLHWGMLGCLCPLSGSMNLMWNQRVLASSEWSHAASWATQAPTHTRQWAYHKASAHSTTSSL